MNRSRSSISTIKSISSSFIQVSTPRYFSSSSQNFLLKPLKASTLAHSRRRRDFSIAAQRVDCWPESDPDGTFQQNPSGSGSGSSLNLQQKPNGFFREGASLQQNPNGFNPGTSIAHQRCDLAECRRSNTNDAYQRRYRGNTGHWNSNSFHRENTNVHFNQSRNTGIGGRFNQVNGCQNLGINEDTFCREGSGDVGKICQNYVSNDMKNSFEAFQQKPKVLPDDNIADDGYPYDNQSGIFRENHADRNCVRSDPWNSLESIQHNPMILSGGGREDDGYPYENQRGFFQDDKINPNSNMDQTEHPVEALQKKPRVIYSGSKVGDGCYFESPSGFFRENRDNNYTGNSLEALRQNPTILSGGSGGGDGRVNPGQLYQNNYGSHRENPLPYDLLNSIESPSVCSPMSNNELSTGESSDIGGMISYEGVLNNLDELCKEQKLNEAIAVFSVFEKVGLVIDHPRYLRLVQACGEAKSLEKARLVHDHLSMRLGGVEVCVHNKILDMYSKCGSMVDAYHLFENMSCRNLTSWETMIRGLSDNGLGEEAIDLFTQLTENGLKPDGGLFTAIFYTCGVLGAIDQGLLYYESMMVDYDIVPIMEHYVSIVDMFGRNGYLDEALEFIEAMPIEPNVDVWETLTSFCIVNGYTELGDRCAEIVEQLDLSRVSEQSKMGLLPKKSIEIANEKETERSSDFDVRGYTHKFMAGRPENYMIYEQIRCLAHQMKDAGYVPYAALTLHDIDLESREEALLYHSERLAIVHGLMTSPARRPLTILKNLRVCSDCHNALKIISNLTGRLIKARDAKRFHHFENGVCSCNDYW